MKAKKKKNGLTEYWFEFIPSKWRRDTVDLSPHEEGVYLRLVIYYMETKLRLPGNESALARIAGISVEEFAKVSEVIHRFFHRGEDGKLWHHKCEEILKDQSERSHKNKKRAKKAAHERWSKGLEKQGQTVMFDAHSMLQADHENATGQDRTGQDKKEGRDSNPESSSKKTPLTPTSSSAQNGAGKSGVSDSGLGKGSGKPFSIRAWMLRNPSAEDAIMRRMLERCPGWDRQVIINQYDSSMDKRGGEPKNPQAAFLGWMEKFYAGKTP